MPTLDNQISCSPNVLIGLIFGKVGFGFQNFQPFQNFTNLGPFERKYFSFVLRTSADSFHGQVCEILLENQSLLEKINEFENFFFFEEVTKKFEKFREKSYNSRVERKKTLFSSFWAFFSDFTCSDYVSNIKI